MKNQKKSEGNKDAFDAFAEILGFPSPAIDPGSGFKVIKGSIANCDLEITCSTNNQATQTTITITNPQLNNLTFEILSGAWYKKGGIKTQNPTFDAKVCCRSKAPEQVLKIVGDETIRLCLQALDNCYLELKKDQFQFAENLDFSPNQFSKYMAVVSVMVRIVTCARQLDDQGTVA